MTSLDNIKYFNDEENDDVIPSFAVEILREMCVLDLNLLMNQI